MFILVLQGFHKNIPQTGCLRQQKLILLQLWKQKLWNERVCRVMFPLKFLGKDPSWPLDPSWPQDPSGSCRQSLAFSHHSNLCLCDHMTFFPVLLFSRCCVWLFATPWTVAHQPSLSMGFSRREYWNELPFPSPGDFPDQGIEPKSPALIGRWIRYHWASREALTHYLYNLTSLCHPKPFLWGPQTLNEGLFTFIWNHFSWLNL